MRNLIIIGKKDERWRRKIRKEVFKIIEERRVWKIMKEKVEEKERRIEIEEMMMKMLVGNEGWNGNIKDVVCKEMRKKLKIKRKDVDDKKKRKIKIIKMVFLCRYIDGIDIMGIINIIFEMWRNINCIEIWIVRKEEKLFLKKKWEVRKRLF